MTNRILSEDTAYPDQPEQPEPASGSFSAVAPGYVAAIGISELAKELYELYLDSDAEDMLTEQDFKDELERLKHK